MSGWSSPAAVKRIGPRLPSAGRAALAVAQIGLHGGFFRTVVTIHGGFLHDTRIAQHAQREHWACMPRFETK